MRILDWMQIIVSIFYLTSFTLHAKLFAIIENKIFVASDSAVQWELHPLSKNFPKVQFSDMVYGALHRDTPSLAPHALFFIGFDPGKQDFLLFYSLDGNHFDSEVVPVPATIPMEGKYRMGHLKINLTNSDINVFGVINSCELSNNDVYPFFVYSTFERGDHDAYYKKWLWRDGYPQIQTMTSMKNPILIDTFGVQCKEGSMDYRYIMSKTHNMTYLSGAKYLDEVAAYRAQNFNQSQAELVLLLNNFEVGDTPPQVQVSEQLGLVSFFKFNEKGDHPLLLRNMDGYLSSSRNYIFFPIILSANKSQFFVVKNDKKEYAIARIYLEGKEDLASMKKLKKVHTIATPKPEPSSFICLQQGYFINTGSQLMLFVNLAEYSLITKVSTTHKMLLHSTDGISWEAGKDDAGLPPGDIKAVRFIPNSFFKH